MQLTLIEQCFTRAMTKTCWDVVERRLEAQSKVLKSKKLTQRNRFVVLFINLLRYFTLIVELLGAYSRPAPQADATIFFEYNPESFAKRSQFLEWNMPDTRFKGVSYDDKICAIPNGRFVWRVMLWLLGTILVSVLYRPSQLTPNLVRVVRTSLLTFSLARASTSKTIYLFRLYRVETSFVAAFLKERGIRVLLVASSALLSFDNRVLIGDSLKVCHPYQVDEFRHYRHLGTCESCELWSPETFHQMETRYKDLVIDEHLEIMGVYTQGCRLRAQLGTLHKDFAAGAIRREAELLEMVLTFASSHSDVHFIIFPHPMERRHYKKTGEHQYGKFFETANVEIDLSDATDSTLQFDRVGLGLTTWSSIGFERIYLGFRTIFYVSDLEYINWDIQSPYHKIFFAGQDAFLSAIDAVRKMTHREFMNHYFGCLFYPNLRSV
ncbi:MAG: hypothetical protein SXV54_00790 [Chloroflexota bacterium]|nr:hypothetical protein [Chloroflexota bacterium]